MSSKLAFPQFALLEQNLQISYYVQDSCESQPQHKMPAYSVVKDLCVRSSELSHSRWDVRFLFSSKGRETIKNPASSAGPSRPISYPGRVRAMLDNLLP